MSKVQQDPLFQIFQKHLNQVMLSDTICEEDLIEQVVADYMGVLNARGYVPPRLYRYLESDVREEVQDMLKKTTYGHFNLAEYKRTSGMLVNKLKVRGS